MESTAEQRVNTLETKTGDPRTGCGRPGCACGLPISERFVLWALRQWQQDRALPAEGSALHQGFQGGGVVGALPDFAVPIGAFLFGTRRAFEIHLPACSSVSRDEATLVALCGLAQGDFDGPVLASLDIMMDAAAS